MVDIREYCDQGGDSPFHEWFDQLHSALYRLGLGNFSNVKSVGSGVYECKINFGPGYRVYFEKEGDRTIVLLGGGTKSRQQQDIATTTGRWQNYKRMKKRPKKTEE